MNKFSYKLYAIFNLSVRIGYLAYLELIKNRADKLI